MTESTVNTAAHSNSNEKMSHNGVFADGLSEEEIKIAEGS